MYKIICDQTQRINMRELVPRLVADVCLLEIMRVERKLSTFIVILITFTLIWRNMPKWGLEVVVAHIRDSWGK